MRRRPTGEVTWTLGLALVLGAAPTARADGDRALSLGFGFATFSLPAPPKTTKTPTELSPDWGLGLGVTYEHGFSTDLSFRGEVVGGLFNGGNIKKESPWSFATLADVGVAFRFDVLSTVPYAFAGVGGVYAAGGPIDTSPQAVLVIGGGVDWLQSRDRSYGLELRLASFAGDITVFMVNLRASSRWGYF
jgi:hypothetical protein